MRPVLILATVVISAIALGERPAATAQRKPLPVIKRTDQAPTTPFSEPPLIVLGSVREQRIIEVVPRLVDRMGTPDKPPAVEKAYRVSLLILRVNERLPTDPDLGGSGDLLLREMPGAPLNLEFGKNYILLIKFAKVIGGQPWRKSDPDPPPYVIAVPDGGFEMVGDKVPSTTLRVLRHGGVLSQYDGKPLDEVFRLITGQSFLEFEPKWR